MNELFGGIKDKKFLFFAVAASVIFITAVFLFIALKDKNKNSENPVATVAPEEITVEEIIESMTATGKDGKNTSPIPEELIKSMTASSVIETNTVKGSENDKVIKHSPAPIPEDLIKSLIIPGK